LGYGQYYEIISKVSHVSGNTIENVSSSLPKKIATTPHITDIAMANPFIYYL